ncbi:TetR/AcrR family transcriptional regulator [Thermopolyspora sp. NPDC052614]|uniref:TetR/AcrR family transcriptional regulator n=1 Tax=Thermopolyspora sp. NPDC052614 TaxID=3155682 RepID=UPI00341FAAAE
MSSEPDRAETSLPPPPWERPAKRTAPARVPLSRDRIVEAAFTVLDREGYAGLSMRRVAAELGVAVSALYAHVRDKDELLELMHNRTHADIPIPEPDPERWMEQVKQYAREVRGRLGTHRDLARISMGQMPFTRDMLPRVEWLFAIFRAGGLPDEMIAAAADMISTYVDGFAYEESLWYEHNPKSDEYWKELIGQLGDYFAGLPPDRFPTLVALSTVMFISDNDERFELGLDVILRGLATYIAR